MPGLIWLTPCSTSRISHTCSNLPNADLVLHHCDKKIMDKKIQRFGSVIGLNPEKEKYYRDLHEGVWPEILKQIEQAGLQNFSIFVTELEGKKYLFSYFEYSGNDFASDMEKMSTIP